MSSSTSMLSSSGHGTSSQLSAACLWSFEAFRIKNIRNFLPILLLLITYYSILNDNNYYLLLNGTTYYGRTVPTYLLEFSRRCYVHNQVIVSAIDLRAPEIKIKKHLFLFPGLKLSIQVKIVEHKSIVIVPLKIIQKVPASALP